MCSTREEDCSFWSPRPSLYIAYIPSPKRSSFFLGHIPEIVEMKRKSGKYQVMVKWANEMGPIFVVFFVYTPRVISTNPDDIQMMTSDENIAKHASPYNLLGGIFGRRFMGRGLVTILDYKTWKPQRKLYDPSFKRSSLKDHLPLFNECVNTFIEKLRPLADGITEVPMKEMFHDTALDVISKVAFSSDFRDTCDSKSLAKSSKLSHLTTVALEGATRSFVYPLPTLFPFLHPQETKMYHDSIEAMRKIGHDCIGRRMKAVNSGEEVPNDILTQILQSCATDDSVDMETLVDNFVTFYVAGQETTANTMLFAIILIHQHPEVLDGLVTEIDEVLAGRKEVTSDDLDKMKYTEQVIQEVLRMYPVVPTLTKESPKGGIVLSGYHIPEGSIVTFNTSVMCRKPEYFPDPDTFDPSRFDVGKPRPGPYVYFPFGVGHRSCIGRHFGMIEVKIVLAKLLQTFKVTLPPSYELVVEQLTSQQPKGDVPCTLQGR